jgi:hypothetical protein
MSVVPTERHHTRRVPITIADVVPTERHHTRRVPIAIAALLVLLSMSLVVVKELKLDCENDYLTVDGTHEPLTQDDGHTRFKVGPPQYWLVAGNVRYPLPTWTLPTLSKFGVLPTECR